MLTEPNQLGLDNEGQDCLLLLEHPCLSVNGDICCSAMWKKKKTRYELAINETQVITMLMFQCHLQTQIIVISQSAPLIPAKD